MKTEEIRDKVEDMFIKETEQFAFLDPNKLNPKYIEWLELKALKQSENVVLDGVVKCSNCGKEHAEICGSCVSDIAQGTAEQAMGSR